MHLIHFPVLAIAALLSLLVPSLALAHAGHVGDLAGHSHWVGWAAAAAAAAVTAWAVKRGTRANADDETSDEATEDEDQPEASKA
jgi:membrane protein implicated in regulation of membrane protease activity